MFQTKKLLLLLLALMMVLTAFTACGNNDNPDDEVTTPEESESNDDGSGTVEDPSVLDGVKFDNEVLKVYSWKASNIPEYIKEVEDGASVVDKAIFGRCDDVETQLNIKTDWNLVDGGGNSTFVTNAELANNTGGLNDLIVCYSNFASNLTDRGALSNLRQYQYFNWDHKAWPHSFVEDCTIANKLYFCTGDISTNLIFMTTVVFWNKDLVEEYNINDKIATKYGEEDLYGLVNSGRWTIDKMYELATDVYSDDGSGKKDAADTYGLITYNTHIENIYYGGGYKTVQVDDGVFSLTSEFKNAQLVGDILKDAIEFFHETDFGYFATETNPHTVVWTIFGEGRALFSMAPASHAYQVFSTKTELEYSVVPVPKHSETQEAYASVQAFPYSMYCIPTNAKEPEITAAFMQGLAEDSAGEDSTRVALFDKMMKGRYSDDPIDADMWQQAIDANVFDLGRIFATSIGKDTSEQLTVSLLRTNFREKNANWQGTLGSDGMRTAQFVNSITQKISLLPD